MTIKFCILGGYGNTGLPIARLLLRHTDAHISLTGRDGDRAEQTAQSLNHEFNTDRVRWSKADASDRESLLQAFEPFDFIINASSTIDYTPIVTRAVIDLKKDYLDTQLSSPQKLEYLGTLDDELKQNDLLFITDCGFHPGVPAALIRLSVNWFDRISSATVYSAFQLNWKERTFSKSTIEEFCEELIDYQPLIFMDRSWQKASMKSMKHMPTIDFSEPFGKKICYPFFLEELRKLPDAIPTLEETGFYISGFNWFNDYFILPFTFVSSKLFPNASKKIVTMLMKWGLDTFSKPPYGATLVLKARGISNGKEKECILKLWHDDAYFLTAIPIVACLLQYIRGELKSRGLYFQAHVVEPAKFIKDMEQLGISLIQSNC